MGGCRGEHPGLRGEDAGCEAVSLDAFDGHMDRRERRKDMTDRLLTTHEVGRAARAEATDRVARAAAEIATRMFPAARWTLLPDERPRLVAVAASGEVERGLVGPDDADAVGYGEVPLSARGLTDVHGLDSAPE